MSDMEVLLSAWFIVMFAGLVFVSLLYWGIRGYLWMRERKHQRYLSAADPMRLSR